LADAGLSVVEIAEPAVDIVANSPRLPPPGRAPELASDHSYEPADTKFTRHVKPSAILNLCSYAEHVERIQGSPHSRSMSCSAARNSPGG
jgi:hypothetical protein